MMIEKQHATNESNCPGYIETDVGPSKAVHNYLCHGDG